MCDIINFLSFFANKGCIVDIFLLNTFLRLSQEVERLENSQSHQVCQKQIETLENQLQQVKLGLIVYNS